MPTMSDASREWSTRAYITPVQIPNASKDTAAIDAMIALIVGLSSAISSSAPALVVMYASANMLM